MKQLKKTDQRYIVHMAIYHVELVYGSPAEGSWYYPAGERVSRVHTYISEEPYDPDNHQWGCEAIQKLRERVQRWLDYICPENKRDLSSVLSEGQYRAEIYRGEELPPEHYPTKTPHYE